MKKSILISLLILFSAGGIFSEWTRAPIKRKNLLINPGFELEWQGWCPYRKQDMARVSPLSDMREVEFDYKVKKDGLCSIKLPPNNGVRSIHIPYNPGKTYTVSFYARWDGVKEGSKIYFDVSAISRVWEYVYLQVPEEDMSTEWKRFSIKFTPKKNENDYRHTFFVKVAAYDCTVWYDSLQVEESETLSDYESGIQVGFKSPNKDALYEKKRKDDFDIWLYSDKGISREMDMQVKINDVSGNIILNRKLKVKPTDKKLSKYNVKLKNKYAGVFNAYVLCSAGGRYTAEGEWRYLVLANPGLRVRNPLFGTEDQFDNDVMWVAKRCTELSSLAGSGFSRDFFKDGLDISPEYREELQAKFKMKKDAGRFTMSTFNPGPGSILLDPTIYPDRQVKAELEKFGAELLENADSFHGLIDCYEILNEPNIWYVSSGKREGQRRMPPDAYIKYLEASHRYLKGKYPDIKIAANINGSDTSYTEDIFKLGAAEYTDIFTIHTYRASAEMPPVYEDIVALRNVIDKYDSSIPIMNSEQYYGTRNLITQSTEDLGRFYSDTDEEHAGRIVQTILHHIAADGAAFNLFAIYATLYAAGYSNPVYYYYTFGGYRAAAELLENIESGGTIEAHDAVRVLFFEKEDGSRIVSINTRYYGKKGFADIRSGYSKVLDFNGNKIKKGTLAIDYLPKYLVYGANVPVYKIIDDIKNADFYGFDFPFRIDVSPESAGSIRINIKNQRNRKKHCTISFRGMLQHDEINTGKMKPFEERTYTIDTGVGERIWHEFYELEYTACSGDMSITGKVRMPSMDIKKNPGIKIDGRISDWDEDDWISLSEENLSRDFGGKDRHKGPEDLSARFQTAWSREGIYLVIDVTDNVLEPGSGAEGQYWKHDSLQVYFDMFDLRRGNDEESGDDVIYSIGFNEDRKVIAFLEANPEGRFVGEANATRGMDSSVKTAFRKTGKGYIYEMLFKAETLPQVKMEDTSIFGFSFIINDSDGKGRKQGITIVPEGQEPYGNRDLWKIVRMAGISE